MPNIDAKVPENSKEHADVVVVTALKEEYDDALKVDTGAVGDWRVSNYTTGYDVAFRNYSGAERKNIRIALTWAPRMRTTASADMAGRLVDQLGAQSVAMSGVCAGRRGVVSPGDVIIGSILYTYDTGSIQMEIDDSGAQKKRIKSDPNPYLFDEQWLHRAQSFNPSPTIITPWLRLRPRPLVDQGDWLLLRLRDGDDPQEHPEQVSHCFSWRSTIGRLRKLGFLTSSSLKITQKGIAHINEVLLLNGGKLPEPLPWRIHVKPLATGNNVVRDPHLFERLSETMREVAGIDMEAAAIAAIAHSRRIPWIVMKGVMDHADNEKDDHFKSFAARASAECLFAFLRSNLPLLRKEIPKAIEISSPPEKIPNSHPRHEEEVITSALASAAPISHSGTSAASPARQTASAEFSSLFVNENTLLDAIQKLFALNHYRVEKIAFDRGSHRALIAQSSDPFGTSLCIKATVNEINDESLSLMMGQLALISERLSGVQKMIVSLGDIPASTAERANQAGIKALTYEAVFRLFQRFEPYISAFLSSEELCSLNAIYEEPEFEDRHGSHQATKFLNNWLDTSSEKNGWLVVTGEYGTGKTALTKVLQYRWLQVHKQNPAAPLPLRIELRHFSRQFDARGLIHHFLDHNNLAHVPADFVLSLIHQGRVVLLLDGYDEMAQYLHVRERRACLEALAELSAGGARGILTSRPNYFTDTEEYMLFDTLYASLKHSHYLTAGKDILDHERKIDSLLENQFVDRFERVLRDLTQDQTEALIGRLLMNDPPGKEAVLRILRRVFRTLDAGETRSLSGKPVIITYLLDVVEELKQPGAGTSVRTEAQVYELIVEKLMVRDLRRTPHLDPKVRLRFLHKLALFLSDGRHTSASEDDFKDLVSQEFRKEFARHSEDARNTAIEQRFVDLRASATLTSSSDSKGKNGWAFSHNSLREFLVFDSLLDGLSTGELLPSSVAVTDAMKIFAASLSEEQRVKYLSLLTRSWKKHKEDGGRGVLLSLLFEAFVPGFRREGVNDPRGACLSAVAGNPPVLEFVKISRLIISTSSEPTHLERVSFRNAVLSDISFVDSRLAEGDFTEATLENVGFIGADLSGASFTCALLIDVDFSRAEIDHCNFVGVGSSDISIIVDRKRLEGAEALGYLKFHGAVTDDLPAFEVFRHHSKYKVVEKILTRLEKQRVHQREGLAHRGPSMKDTDFADSFLSVLVREGHLEENRPDYLEVTERGRDMVSQFIIVKILPQELLDFLMSYRY